MWKTAFTLFIFLVSVLSGVLYWHWAKYSELNMTVEDEEIEQVETVVTVKSYENLLSITQQFSGLIEKREYRITMPEFVSEWSCLKEDGEPCDTMDDNPHSFMAENGMLKISYLIPLNHEDKPFLLQHFIGSLTGLETLITEIQIIDQGRRNGIWVAGLPLIGASEQEMIDYYVFEGTLEAPSLYWQPNKLTYEKTDVGLNYFYNNGPINFELPTLELLTPFEGMTIVLTDEYPETNARGMMITKPDISGELLQRKIVHNYFAGKGVDFALEQIWLFDVLTALLTEDNSLLERGQIFIEEMKNQLSTEEISQFMANVIEQKTITPQKLDELLGSTVGKKTRYFSLNSNEETALLPLYFYDGRIVRIDDKNYDDLLVLIKEDKRLFPFGETLEALGFEVKVLSDEETILINKDNNSYRFFIGQNIFIYNQEDYGLLSNPLQVINGKIYTDAGWLQTIFKVKITETADEIILSENF